MGIFIGKYIIYVFSPFKYIFTIFFSIFLFEYIENLPGAIFHNNSRYLYIFIPFFVMFWASAILKMEKNIISKLYLPDLMMSIACFSCVMEWENMETGVLFSRNAIGGVSQWVTKNIPPNDVILIHDAGYISEHVPQKLVDIVGLKTPHNIIVNKKYIGDHCHKSKLYISDIAETYNAKHIIVTKAWNEIFMFTKNQADSGWTVQREDIERTNADYQVYRISKKP